MDQPYYRLFLIGMMCAEAGFQILTVAIGWHVFTINHSALDLGLIGLALFVPVVALVLPAGIAIDRYDRRAIIVTSLLVQGIGCVGLGLAAYFDVRIVAVYLAVLAIVGAGRAFSNPALRTLLPNIVDRETFVRAQATSSMAREFVTIAGPAVGGALVAINSSLGFLAAAIAYGVAAVALGAIHIVRVMNKRGATTWRDALQGLHFIVSKPIVAGAITLDLFGVLFGGAVALLPAFASDVFHVGSTGLGVLRSAGAVGALLVAAYLGRRPPQRRIGLQLLLTVAGFGLATVAFGLSKNFWLSLFLLAVIGGTDMLSVVIRNGIVQLATPDHMRGRVSSVEQAFIGASNQLGAFESGTVAALVGIVGSVVIGGVGTLVVIGICAAAFPQLRSLQRFDASLLQEAVADAEAVVPS